MLQLLNSVKTVTVWWWWWRWRRWK